MENELSRVVDALSGLVWTARPDGHADIRVRALPLRDGEGRAARWYVLQTDVPCSARAP